MYREVRGSCTNDTILAVVDTATGTLDSTNVAKRVSRRATLLLEELLLRYQEQLGVEAALSFSVTKRLGTVRMRVEVAGRQLNALDITAADDSLGDEYDFIAALTEDDLEPPTYGYRRGVNVITISMRVQKQRPLWADPMFVATVLAVLAFFGLSRANAGLATGLAQEASAPIVSVLMGVLSAISGPLLSVSLISGICALGDVATLKGMGRRAIGRIMAWVTVLFAVSAAVSLFFYHSSAGQTSTSFKPGELFELLLSAIPTNLFSPFVEGNSLQIAVESGFVGICLLALGERSKRIKALVIELNSLLFKMMYLFSEALPMMVGLSIFNALATTDTSSLRSLGMMVAVNFGIVAILAVGTLAWAVVFLRISPALFLKKISSALIVCLATGSTTSAMGEFFGISSDKLGISKKVVDFWVPIGHAMFSPSVIIPLVVGMFAVSTMEGVAIDATRLAILFLLVFQMSIATPKVPGGIAATFTILLGQLGLPLESVGILMAANVFVCNVNTAFGALVRFTELCTFAKSEHAIDEERLRAAG